MFCLIHQEANPGNYNLTADGDLLVDYDKLLGILDEANPNPSLNRLSLTGYSIFCSTGSEDNTKFLIIFRKYSNCINASFSLTATTWTFSNSIIYVSDPCGQSFKTVV